MFNKIKAYVPIVSFGFSIVALGISTLVFYLFYTGMQHMDERPCNDVVTESPCDAQKYEK